MIGTWVLYHDPLWGHFNQISVVTRVTEDSIGLSLPKFKGDYLFVPKTSAKIQYIHVSQEEKLIALSSFGWWWFQTHKSVFQESLVSVLRSV